MSMSSKTKIPPIGGTAPAPAPDTSSKTKLPKKLSIGGTSGNGTTGTSSSAGSGEGTGVGKPKISLMELRISEETEYDEMEYDEDGEEFEEGDAPGPGAGAKAPRADGGGDDDDDEEEEEEEELPPPVQSSSTIEISSIQPEYHNKFRPGDVVVLIKSTLQSVLQGQAYDEALVDEWIDSICSTITDGVVGMNFPRYKIIVQTIIGELRGQCVSVGSRSLMDLQSDSNASWTFQNDTLFATTNVYGLYYY